MPRIARARFCCIGPRDARIEDMTLDFRDSTGRAIDAAIWLKNGGGKTTILRLLLALVCPDQRKLFPGRSDFGDPRLEDYVQLDDHGVVAIEWELDIDPRNSSNTTPSHYLTGVFYERQPTADVEDRLRRLFFGTRVIPEEPRLTLEGLPLYTRENGQSMRRIMTVFRQEWHDLNKWYQVAEIKETENPISWTTILEDAGLDPALFGYQIRMNRREGGAEDLFKFRDVDQFIDFLLELALNSGASEQIERNIEAFRVRYRDSATRIGTELELAGGIATRLQPLSTVIERRQELQLDLIQTGSKLHHLQHYISQLIHTFSERISQAEQQLLVAQNVTSQSRATARDHDRHALALHLRIQKEQLDQLRVAREDLRTRKATAEREEQIWIAAASLRALRRLEYQIKELEIRLEQTHAEAAPILQELKQAAWNYAAALRARTDYLNSEVQKHTANVNILRSQANEHLNTATQHDVEIGRLKEQITQTTDKLQALQRIRTQLEAHGTLLPNESWASAQHRLAIQQTELHAERNSMRQTLEQLNQQLANCDQRITAVIRDEEHAARVESEIRERLKQAYAERNAVEQNEWLHRYLQCEVFDIDTLNTADIEQLHQGERAQEVHIFRLWSALAEQDNIINELETTQLLPPSRDVTTVLQALIAAGIIAWSGWSYLGEIYPPSKMRDVLQRIPELASGIIVRDTHYEQARNVLDAGNLQLYSAVVIAPQQTTQDIYTRKSFVVGPTSDAHFNTTVAPEVLREWRGVQARDQSILKTARDELVALRRALAQFEQVRQRYPHMWIEEQQATLRWAVDQQRICQVQHATYISERQQLVDQVTEGQQRQELLGQGLLLVVEQQARINTVTEHHDTDPVVLEAQISSLADRVETHRYEAQQLRTTAEEVLRQAQSADNQAQKAAHNANDMERAYRDPRSYLNDDPPPQSGHIEQMGYTYQQLRDTYKQLTSRDADQGALRAYQDQANEERRKFDTKLQGMIDEEIVQLYLDSLTNFEDVEQRSKEARDTHIQAHTASVQHDGLVDQIQRKVQELQQIGIQKGMNEADYDVAMSVDITDLEYAADKEERSAQEAERTADQYGAEATETSEHVSQLKNQYQMALSAQDRLRDIADTYTDLLEGLVDRTNDLPEIDISDGNLDQLITDIRQSLKQAQKVWREIDAERAVRIRDVTGWMDARQFVPFDFHWVRQLKQRTDEDYERDFTHILDQVNLRIQQLEGTYADIEQDKSLLVEGLEKAASDGIRLVKSAMSRSRLPNELQAFGGRLFLTINSTDTNDPAERQRRLVRLIDAAISGDMPTGMTLVQQAVRRLLTPITVSVLAPRPNNPEPIPITAIGKLSGGERLTCAVLLYCTLVKLRARERGRGNNGSSTLLLDNPIGASSRRRFLKLQRTVAHAMGVQLIYTTGIKDYEAIRVFPRVVRLRNQRTNQLTGDQLLEWDANLDSTHALMPELETSTDDIGSEDEHVG